MLVICGLLGLAMITFAGWNLARHFRHFQEVTDTTTHTFATSSASEDDAPQGLGGGTKTRTILGEPSYAASRSKPTNALAAPTSHLELEYASYLAPHEAQGRSISADEAFWSQDVDIVRQWARENALEPATDWGIILSGSLSLADLVSLATDPDIAALWEDYFIGSAHIRVGDLLKKAQRSGTRDSIEAEWHTIVSAQNAASQTVQAWARHAHDYLLGKPIPLEVREVFEWDNTAPSNVVDSAT